MPRDSLALIALLMPLHLGVVTQRACAPGDQDGDGFTVLEGDCDDRDASVYPGALEVCDGKDDDCDGVIDEGLEQSSWYPDADRDGYGVTDDAVQACGAPAGYVGARGDCNDTDSRVHPGADDTAGDGVDQDCGGNDGPQPCVGFPSTRCGLDVQAAVRAAEIGDTVWVAPGTYVVSFLDFDGKAMTLESTDGPAVTIFDALQEGPVVSFENREFHDTVVNGFTVTGGAPGIFMYEVYPTLEDLVIRDNHLDCEHCSGGGMFMVASGPVLRHCTITENSAQELGGGIFMQDSNPTFIDCDISSNTAGLDGGGIYGYISGPVFDGCTITHNSAVSGGGLFFDGDGPEGPATLTDTDVSDNTATADGGGIYLLGSVPIFASSTITGNQAASSGGGMLLSASRPSFTDCLIADNFAESYAGGISFGEGSDATLEGCTISGNATASAYFNLSSGGGMGISASSPTFSHCRFLDNITATYGGGTDISGGAQPVFDSCLFSGNVASYGGAMMVFGSSPILTHVEFEGNYVVGTSGGGGGGAVGLASGSAGDISYCLFANNTAALVGGGLFLESSSPTIDHAVFVGNVAGESGGGGIYLTNGSMPVILNAILAYNQNYNLFDTAAPPGISSITYSDLYAVSGEPNTNLSSLDPTNLTVEPRFLVYGSDGLLSDYHLALDSPLIDQGSPAELDPDGSPADIGLYGGPGADQWDRDDDGFPDYFWPGEIGEPPAGFSPLHYDCDDEDASIHFCRGEPCGRSTRLSGRY